MKISQKKGDDFAKIDRILEEIFQEFGGLEAFENWSEENEDQEVEFFDINYMVGES